MLKNKNIFIMLIVLLTILVSNNDLFAHKTIKIDDSLVENGNIGVLNDSVFTLLPERWGIVQGRVSDQVALKNKEILNSIIVNLKKKGITTLQIGALDAYFKVDVNSINREKNAAASIQIPSNFNLVMSNNTFLRVQPNAAATYTLMSVNLQQNTTITGGNLIGDRFEHNYAPITDDSGVKRDEHGWGFLLWIIGSEKIMVDNVKLSNATGDGLVFHSQTLRNNDGALVGNTREVNNVIVKNLSIDKCRRNGISVLDGRYITIDNCNITNTGNGSQAYDSSGKKIYSSAGTAPMYGIDLEAIRTRNSNGTLNKTALIENVTIKNSRFTGNEAGDLVLYTASYVTVENNYFDKWIGNMASDNVVIDNNTFESRDPSFFAIGINSFIDPFGKELNHDYIIKNNKIKNYSVGIRVAGEKQTVSNNIITDCQTGIFFISDLKDSKFSKNTITSSLTVSYGYKNFSNANNITNVTVTGDKVNVMNRPISFINMLNNSTLRVPQLTFSNCIFNTGSSNFPLYINNGKNISFIDNTSNTPFSIINSTNISLVRNLLNK